MLRYALLLPLLALTFATATRAQSLPAAAIVSAPPPPTIVVGFMGGRVAHDDAIRNELIISKHLRVSYPPDVHFAVFENRRLEDAHQMILRLLDDSANHPLPEQEKRRARIILYGHSWGASAAVTLADELQKDGIPVLLTVQVDSVEKHGQNDAVIPDNVARAINFYQPDGLLHGRQQILAANPAGTQILGNFRYSYKDKDAPAACHAYPWFERMLIKTHIAIECDPILWNRIESLIRDTLGRPSDAAAGR